MNNVLQRNPLARNPQAAAASAAIKIWVRAAFGHGEGTIVSVSELSCSKPGCPPRETVILLLPAGGDALRMSIHKTILDVCEQDVVAASLKAERVDERAVGRGQP